MGFQNPSGVLLRQVENGFRGLTSHLNLRKIYETGNFPIFLSLWKFQTKKNTYEEQIFSFASAGSKPAICVFPELAGSLA